MGGGRPPGQRSILFLSRVEFLPLGTRHAEPLGARMGSAHVASLAELALALGGRRLARLPVRRRLRLAIAGQSGGRDRRRGDKRQGGDRGCENLASHPLSPLPDLPFENKGCPNRPISVGVPLAERICCFV